MGVILYTLTQHIKIEVSMKGKGIFSILALVCTDFFCLVVFIKMYFAYLAVGLNRYDCVLEGSLIRLSLNIVLILSNTLTEGSFGTVKL